MNKVLSCNTSIALYLVAFSIIIIIPHVLTGILVYHDFVPHIPLPNNMFAEDSQTPPALHILAAEDCGYHRGRLVRS